MSPFLDWVERLLFGSTPCFPPKEVKSLILRMEADNIPWSHIIRQGGFTAFPYQVHGDLNSLVDYLETQWLDDQSYEPPAFKTRAVSKFWEALQLLLARREAIRPAPLPPPSPGDDAILQDFLGPQPRLGPHAFESAAFWGEVARRFINLRRPVSVAAVATPERRLMQLYEMRGEARDPWTLHLVPYSEYVNAAHWQSDRTLEAFMHDRPRHPLTLSIQALLKRTVHEMLHAEKPSAFLDPCPRLDALLYNVRVIHEAVQQVPNGPPKMIDVLQRLLALSYRDGLWEREVPLLSPPHHPHSLDLLHLTEGLRRSERCVQGPPEHTCSDYLYARDKYRPH